jgi:hypothetical protein
MAPKQAGLGHRVIEACAFSNKCEAFGKIREAIHTRMQSIAKRKPTLTL